MNKKQAFEIASGLNNQTHREVTPGQLGIEAARADARLARTASAMSSLKESPEDWNGRALAARR